MTPGLVRRTALAVPAWDESVVISSAIRSAARVAEQVRARRQLGTELRRLRLDGELAQREVAAALDWSQSKLLRIENGQVGIRKTDLKALLELYGASDEQTGTLLDLARTCRRAGGSNDAGETSITTLLRHESAPWHLDFERVPREPLWRESSMAPLPVLAVSLDPAPVPRSRRGLLELRLRFSPTPRTLRTLDLRTRNASGPPGREVTSRPRVSRGPNGSYPIRHAHGRVRGVAGP